MKIEDFNYFENNARNGKKMENGINEKISNEQISMISTGSSDAIDTKTANEAEAPAQENTRFSLRKRRNINYNFKTKKFEYDDDSDYEEKPKKKSKKK